jgi:Helitron helicase-like domain at N-terminus
MIAATHGPPTFFITFTCNAEWPEIRNQLLPGQTYTDIPSVVCRVFKQKMSKLMQSLRTMFPNTGGIQYAIQRVEFQKQGLPHAHILIKYSKPCVTANDIDMIVSACIPDNNEEDASLVRKFMLHFIHPSNIINHQPPDADHPLKYCERWKDGSRVCQFGYPKPLQQHTEINDTGHVLYARLTEED